MFIELMALIEKRAITITVAALKDGHVRVNIVPAAWAEDSKVNEKIGYSNKDKISKIPESAVHALTTPLSLTGAPIGSCTMKKRSAAGLPFASQTIP
jgi:hypothetical protein